MPANAPELSPEETAAIVAESQRAYELDRAHVFHSWSAQQQITPMVVSRAQGSYVFDGDGKRYLDFTSQLVNTNIGHQHPAVVQAIKDQADLLCTINPAHANAARSEAARLITERTPAGLDHVFFTNAGADANEHAIRMARQFTGRRKVLSRYHSYHGGTDLAVNVTGDPRRIPSDTADSGVVHFFGPFLYRSEFDAQTEEQETRRALHHLERTIQLEGPETIAAIILESIPGTAGIMIPSDEYMQGVRELATKYGIVYIADEVMAGFGRAGSWFAFERFGIVPDVITFAKGVNSGYVPLGGVVMNDAIYSHFGQRSYPGGLTYSGHPLACAAAVATINAMADEGMVDNAARLGEEIVGPRLEKIAANAKHVGEVRGTGMFWAIELVKDQESREPLAPYGGGSPEVADILAKIKAAGVLPFNNFNRIHVVPPLNVTEEELNAGLDVIEEVLTQADYSV
ncbi:aspartate aminotransferase family protein [Brevibacterium sp. 50QC2O2]|uniref:aspartate aminotransferase family protein n=1 Tax=Brevibacterium TaxID=1696 RepID=UPI00211C77EB|nr:MULTISPECIES: aspartate aminotransferase family protein [unclassified Brevibacterium]MCQ9368125.1 aspartate aminotransferase family protein [Brevibacterium sp. 91QC2O2]MCQ9386056.1 aspartate aminotransferase family protein [Brevibacterium sp. 68QC2CO]MCQ9387652.1 aspartate aminotransferase family protein [Brevibacterium sp. 50QC2O2]